MSARIRGTCGTPPASLTLADWIEWRAAEDVRMEKEMQRLRDERDAGALAQFERTANGETEH